MKKLFSLMLAFACALFVGVSCTPNQPVDDQPITIGVTGAPEANLAPEAGEFSLNYTLTNAPLTAVLSVTTEAAWLHVGEVGVDAVPFTYDANTEAPGSPAREAAIVFAVEGAEPVTVTVKQDSQAAAFTVEFLNVTPQAAQIVCTPADNEMLYLLATSQDLGQYGVQGETPNELMKNYVDMLAMYGMLTGEADQWFVFKGSNAEMPKEASRWSAEESVAVYAVGISVTATGEVDEYGTPVVNTAMVTTTHVWEVPFLPYPTLTIAEADLNKTVSSAAGEVVIDCAIENPVEGTEVLVETEAAWVTASYADGKLTLAYEANTAAVDRRAKIAVSYGYYTNPTEITLVQEKDSEAVAVTLNIEVVSTQFNGITVNVTPSDENATYALNQCAVEKDWETGAELEMDWSSKAEDLLSYTGTATFHKGALTNHFIKMNPSNYEWNGYDYYVYAVPVEATSSEETDYWGNVNTVWTVSQILGEVAYTNTTIDASKMPSLAWDLTKTEGLVWNESNERYDLEVVEGSTVVLHFDVNNPVEGAFLTLNGTSLYDSFNVVDGEPVVDNAAGTITFNIDKFDTAKSYHYVSPSFKYTNAEGDIWGITTPDLRLTQVEDPGMQLPYQESFAENIGNFTINNVSLDGLEYVWSWNTYKYMKATAYVSSVRHATESWLVSPKIDLSTATMPGLQFSHTHKFAGTPSEELTLWVKEYGAAEWTQVTIPTYGTNNDWTFVTAAVDLSAWAGKKVQIGFKYTSTTSVAATWEVKDVVVYDAGGAAAPIM